MFFPELIKSIQPTDKVLEIGPGASPYKRANEFLEYSFESDELAISQRGSIKSPAEFGGRKVTYYNGDIFPFSDNQFDYVIASHVIEHVPNPTQFLLEMFRVGGGRGYIEFPLPTYDYLYDFDVHLNFIWQNTESGDLIFLKKEKTHLNEFATINSALREGFEKGWDDLVRNNLSFFFMGFEFHNTFECTEASDLREFNQAWRSGGNSPSRKAVRRLENIFNLIASEKK